MERELFTLPEIVYLYYDTHHGWRVHGDPSAFEDNQHGVLVGVYRREKVAKFRVNKVLEDIPQEDVLPIERPH